MSEFHYIISAHDEQGRPAEVVVTDLPGALRYDEYQVKARWYRRLWRKMINPHNHSYVVVLKKGE